MPIILRIDVDKPYGNNTLFRKIISKVREDYYFPAISSLGYLDQVNSFANLLHDNNISAIFYFRNCTAPTPKLIDILKQQGHCIGFHAENTRSIETFREEIENFSKLIKQPLSNIHSFSKHGSGYHKLGRKHYAPYEEDKYHHYSEELNIPFPFGNGMMENFEGFDSHQAFYRDVFWMEGEYRTNPEMSIDRLVSIAKTELIPVLIHPENYYNRPQTMKDFDALLLAAKTQNITWTTNLAKISKTIK